jgi:SAM-dependent methyltransferase
MFTKSAAFYDAVYSFKNYEAEAERLHALIQERTPASTLLDVACGTGQHLQYLSQWYAAEGVDLDPELLDIARQRLPDVRFHQADMTDFDLGRQFGAVVSLFSAIGYVKTVERLDRAVACMAKHIAPGGVLVIEPWFTPEHYTAGRPSAVHVDKPGLKITRMNVSAVEGTVSVLDFHYLVATPEGVSHFVEHHELGMFTDQQYRQAFEATGLLVEHDPEGLMGRGLYIGTKRDSR